MEALLIHPKTKEQANVLKVLFKEMKVPFERAEEKPYDEEWVKTMRKSERDEKEGKLKSIKLEDLWK